LFVHFAIFDWLAGRVLTWADGEIERYFARREIGSHLWALRRIEPEFRWSYMRQAAFQFVSTKRSLGARELLRIGASSGPGAVPFGTNSLLLALLGSPKKAADRSLSSLKPGDIKS